jgi:hypothetical protein
MIICGRSRKLLHTVHSGHCRWPIRSNTQPTKCTYILPTEIYQYKNIRVKLHEMNTAIWLHKMCTQLQITPHYISIKVNGSNRQRRNTLKSTTQFRISTFQLLDSFTPCQLCIKVANFVLCGTVLVCFPDEDPLWIETRRNIQCDIIIQISKEKI